MHHGPLRQPRPRSWPQRQRPHLLQHLQHLLGVLGDNPDKSHWANNGVPKEAWKTGVTTAPHGLCFDADGNLYVQDWNGRGRVHKFIRSQD